MKQAIRGGSPGEPVEILTTTSDLVPTASNSEQQSRQPAPLADSTHREIPQVDWQIAMKRAIRSSDELRTVLGLAKEPNSPGKVSFPTFVPLEFLRRIRPGDERDPLLLQVLASGEEAVEQNGFVSDPVGDLEALAAGGLLHKYDGRALVISTGACGIHCRYCFRREFPYDGAGSQRENWRPSIDYIGDHVDVDEVILSGGDPLTLVDQKLFKLIDDIESIEHVQRLRIHTRMPIVIPQRVTDALVRRLAASRLAVWVVIHANHPNELDRSVTGRLRRLTEAGIPLLNQAVLLRGVNDCAETLIKLCRELVNHRIGPYYLHQLDRVRGTAHFEVPVAEGLRLMQRVRAALPGYAVPQYVVEQPGEPFKTPLRD